jgi:RNA polymerase sigma-70 factor (ECF subfamily)
MAAQDPQMSDSPGQITLLLADMKRGDPAALPKLVPMLYDELRRLAGSFLRGERPGHTLQPTALVHEAYLKLVGQRGGFENRAQFLAVAAQAMRRILVDYARQRLAAKRGGGGALLDLEVAEAGATVEQSRELIAVDQALEKLTALDARQARVVELRYFGGLTVEETAAALDIAPRTVKREWAMAKAWLRVEISSWDRE